MRRCVVGWAVAGILSGPSSTRADDAPCAQAHVTVDGALDASWAEAVRELCSSMPNTPDLDPTARVLVVAGAPVRVVVSLADGRVAAREVRDPVSLRHSVEALVVVPPTRADGAKAGGQPEAATAADDASPANTHAAPKPQDEQDPRDAKSSVDPGPAAPASFSVELGAALLGRVHGVPLYVGVGPTVWAALDYSNWLFELNLRFDAWETRPSTTLVGFEMLGFGSGVAVAHRFDLADGVALDIGLGAQIIEELQSAGATDDNQAGQATSNETAGEATDLRLLVPARLHVGGPGFRFTATVEPEMSPVRVGRDVRIDPSLPQLPSFGIGAGIGLSWQGP